MEFGILGCLEVRAADGRLLPLGRPCDQAVLATLLVDAGRIVAVPRLVDAVWDDDPPATAAKQVRNAVSRLRSLLAGYGLAGAIETEGAGYRLAVDHDAVDVSRFDALTAGAGRAAAEGRRAGAAEMLAEALDLWRGPALSGMAGGVLEAAAETLNERRHTAAVTYYDHQLALGRHQEVISELYARAADQPLREEATAQLMLALYRSGRRADALAACDRVRRVMAEQLGLDPGTELRRLRQQVLTSDQALDPPVQVAPSGAAQPGDAVPGVPRQLPCAVPHFTGRADELRAMSGLLERASSGGAVVVSAVGGTAGIGKTALAVHWAHQVTGRFPDGQLYVNLRGFDASGTHVSATEALRGFLAALGVAPQQVPRTQDEQAALFRSLTADRRMLILLDNARDSSHARPLLPGSPGCQVVVTSRVQLAGLVAAEGAHPITLGLLDRPQSRELLADRIGDERLAAEPGPARELISLCAGLPLALAIVGARAAIAPTLKLATLAAELRDTKHRLDALELGEAGDGGASMRSVFSWSYRQLTPLAAHMLRLLGVHPGPDITAPAAASLAGAGLRDAARALAELARANLITEHMTGRFTFHDLLRIYASEQAGHDDEECREATHRALDHYLHTAYAAASLIGVVDPLGKGATLSGPLAGVTPETLDGREQAVDWFESERAVLLAVISLAADTGFDSHAWQIACVLSPFFDWRGYWHDWASAQQAALAAAQRRGDKRGQAHAHLGLGRAFNRIASFDDSDAHLRQAGEVYREVGDLIGEARAVHSRSVLYESQGRYQDSLGCAQACLELYRAGGHQAGEVTALNAVGWFHALLGRHEEALGHCQLALELGRQLGDLRAQASTHDSLGYVHSHMGQHDQAITCYRNALRLVTGLADRMAEADVRVHIGDAEHAAGHPDRARESWLRALTILDGCGHLAAGQVRAKLNDLEQATGMPCHLAKRSGTEKRQQPARA
ncbi:MAG TPA: BTAD domain-containing putative transcriptional regulator [Streptosporangiaceae bacterium]|nr:BTAD domain-containing putative transcriptional regulator [Streptosporangiaceae bacterium]